MTPLKSAYASLKSRLVSGDLTPGARLLSLARLARQCNVCRTTMWRAVKLLQQENLLHTRERGSIIAGPLSDNKPAFAGTAFAWERVKERLGQEILGHQYVDRILPGINKLAMRYGTAINTMRKALDGLVQEGLLVRTGRRYQRAVSGHPRYQPAIAMIAQKNAGEHLFTTDPRTEQVVHGLEWESHLSGFSTMFEVYDHKSAAGFLRTSTAIKEIPNLAGCLVNLWNPWNQTFWQRWLDLLGFLVDRGMPVIALDQEGDLVFPPELLRRRNFRVLRIGGARAGEIMGTMLLEKGHKHAAFVSPIAGMLWASRRYEGLKRCYERYGDADAKVELHSREESADGTDITLAVLGLDADAIRTLYGRQLAKEEIADLVERLGTKEMARLKRVFPPNRAITTVRSFARNAVSIARTNPDGRIYSILHEALQTAASSEALHEYRADFYKSILKSSDATVWVCSDDLSAFDALEFLRKQHRIIPDEIAVTGFDDMKESLGHGITTYNFNMTGMVQTALRMIFDAKALTNAPVSSEVDGYVVERKTTRR